MFHLSFSENLIMANVNISALANLLKPKDEDSDSEDEIIKVRFVCS